MRLALVKIRLKQLSRSLNGMGAFILALPILIGVLCYGLYRFLQDPISAKVILLLSILSLLQIHLRRKDLNFLKHHIKGFRLEITFEYFILSIPILLLFIITGNLLAAFVFIIACLILPFIPSPASKAQTLNPFLNFIPANAFEWRSGIRKYWYYLLPLILLSIIFCWVRILPLILIYIATTIIFTFYQQSESLAMLKVQGKNRGHFLRKKCANHLLLLNLIILIPLGLNYLFQPSDGWLVLILFLGLNMIYLFVIFLKYANFEPERDLSSNGLTVALASLCPVIPYLAPIPIIFCFIFFFKARKNLKLYFDA